MNSVGFINGSFAGSILLLSDYIVQSRCYRISGPPEDKKILTGGLVPDPENRILEEEYIIESVTNCDGTKFYLAGLLNGKDYLTECVNDFGPFWNFNERFSVKHGWKKDID